VAGRQPSREVVERLVRLARTDSAGPVQLHLASAIGRLADGPAWALAESVASADAFATDTILPKLVWFGLAPSVPRHPDEAVKLAATTTMPQMRRNLSRMIAGRVDERPDLVAAILETAVAGDDARRRDLVTGLADGLRGWRQAAPPTGYAAMSEKLAASPDEATVQAVRELDVLFGEGRGMEVVRQVALDGSATPEARRQAVRTLVAAVPEDGAVLLHGLLGDRPVIAEALAGLARYDHPDTPAKALGPVGIFAPADRVALVDLLASRPAYAAKLLDAVEAGQIRSEEISAFHARQIADFGDAALAERLGKLWGQVRVSAADKKDLIGRYRGELTDEVVAAADRSHGRALFARDCAGCHVLFGEGRKLGPDLTGSNRKNLDYLLENVIDPGASVGADFRAVSFLLADGRAVTGVISASDERTLTVQTAQAPIVLDRHDIAEQTVQDQSLMPDGLLTKLSDGDVRDLVAYLMAPGQVPLPDGAAALPATP
jgi:putative heme-binding domain-containing protein